MSKAKGKCINQIDLIGVIAKELDRQGVKSAPPRAFNAIIAAANSLIEEVERGSQRASHAPSLTRTAGSSWTHPRDDSCTSPAPSRSKRSPTDPPPPRPTPGRGGFVTLAAPPQIGVEDAGPKTYREMNTPRPHAEARTAMEDFYKDLAELCKKHRIADLVMLVRCPALAEAVLPPDHVVDANKKVKRPVNPFHPGIGWASGFEAGRLAGIEEAGRVVRS